MKPVRVKVNDKMQCRRAIFIGGRSGWAAIFASDSTRSDYGAVSSPLDLSECYGMIQGFGDCVSNTKLILNHTSVGAKIAMLPVTDSPPVLFRGARW
jgi:hypothetical protein